MTTIVGNGFDPSSKELEIPFQGDRDLGDNELRRTSGIVDFKVKRLGDSLYPEGFITDGLAASLNTTQNLVHPSNDFAAWVASGGIAVTPSAAADRYGDLKATRLTAATGQPSSVAIVVPGQAKGRKVFALDILHEITTDIRIVFNNGVSDVAHVDISPTVGQWERVSLAHETWGVGASDLTITVFPSWPNLPGSCLIAMASLEEIAPGAPMVAGAYVATTTAAATGPGNVVTISSGSAYAKGLPRPFAAQSLTLDPMKRSGIDTVYAEVAERYILGTVAPGLMNPITGGPGNDSVREETQFVKIDTTNASPAVDPVEANPQYRSRYATPVFQIDRATGIVLPVAQQGNIDVGVTRGVLDGRRVLPQSLPEDRLDLKATEGQPGLLAAQARRMNNAAGDFVVNPTGGDPTISQDTTVTSAIRLKVDPLDGYTQGRAHYLEVPQYIQTDLQTTTNRRQNENHTFYTAQATYALSKTPVTAVNELVGIFQVTETVTRGAVPNGKDELTFSPVFQVISVAQGATTYTVGPAGDCIQNGDAIDWVKNPAPHTEPVAGSSYTVVYQYSRVWPANEYQFTTTGITFTGANKPVNNLPITVDYQYGQDRVDLVILGRDGLEILKGTPSDHPAPPPVPQGALALWEVTIAYGSQAASITPVFVTRVSMAQLAAMNATINNLTYNVAQLATNASLRDRNNTLKGIVTDPMLDERLFDKTAALFTGAGAPVAARIADGYLKQARTQYNRALTVNTAGTTMTLKGTAQEWAGLPYTEAAQASLTQTKYSDNISVNPFAGVDVTPATLVLSTQQFRWFTRMGAIIRSSTSATVTGNNFAPSETIAIFADAAQIGTVTADAKGRFSQVFTTTLTETTLIKAVGATSGLIASQTVGAIPRTDYRDPVGQTFVPVNGDITGIDLYFSAKAATAPVTVAIRITANGFPSPQVIAQKQIDASAVSLTGATRFTFDQPVRVTDADQLSLVVSSPSADYRVRYAKLGKLNANTGGGYISTQAYGSGVMFASSDNRAWTPYQDQDLAFAVYMAKYATNTPAVLMTNPEVFTAPGVTSFVLDVAQETLDSKASIVWEYTTDAGVSWHAFNPGDTVQLTSGATTLQFRATAKTSDVNGLSGVAIFAQNMKLTAYQDALASSYVTLATTLLQNVTSAKAYIVASLPAGTSATPKLTNDGGATWTTGTLSNTRGVSTDLYEFEYAFTFGSSNNQFRGRIDLQASSVSVQPLVDQASFVIL